MEKTGRIIIGLIMSIVILSFIMVPIVFWINFKEFTMSVNTEHWGQLGDFFGGLLNPIVGLANLLAISYFGYYGFIKDKENLKKQLLPLPRIEFEQD